MSSDTDGAKLGPHNLRAGTTYRIGRGSECEIAFAGSPIVSRLHATMTFADGSWTLRDEGSTNGTYVNGREIAQPTALADGDRVIVGRDGPSLAFVLAPVPVRRPSDPREKRPASSVSLSELLPFLSKDRSLVWKNPYFLPGVVTVVACLILLLISGMQSDDLQRATAAIANPQQRIEALEQSIYEAIAFNDVLGVYLCAALYFAVVKLTGRRKPVWLAAAVVVTTMLVLVSPLWEILAFLFKDVLPGNVDLGDPFSLGKFIHTFIGIGLLEELVKQLPVLALVFAAPKMSAALRAKIGINDQLDGIVVATASAAGFIVFETLGQYVGGQFSDLLASFGRANFDPAAALTTAGLTEATALQTLVFRILSETVGHVAYSGYFGYAIGLAVLHRRHFWRIAGIGWLVAATLHALWDSMVNLGPIVQLAIGVASLAVLLAAIRRARRERGLSVPLARGAIS